MWRGTCPRSGVSTIGSLQVFENLIGNAIKFTTAGGLITVGAASRDQEVVFWVADSGSGIAPGCPASCVRPILASDEG